MEMESPLFSLDSPLGDRIVRLTSDEHDEPYRATVRKTWSDYEAHASRPRPASLSPKGSPSAFGSSPNDVTGLQFTAPKSAAAAPKAQARERLESRHSTDASTTAESSSVTEMREHAYLTTLECEATNVTPFFLLQDPLPLPTSQVARASSLVLATLRWCVEQRASATDADTWRTSPRRPAVQPSDSDTWRTSPDGRQYSKHLGSARVQRERSEEARRCPSSRVRDARHVAVMSRGQVYAFAAFDATGDIAVSEQEVAATLRGILEHSSEIPAVARRKTAVGVLTSMACGAWVAARKALEAESAGNAAGLRLMDDALLVLNLDDERPAGLAEASKLALHGSVRSEREGGVQVGSCLNRWYNKVMQIIVFDDGTAAVNFEHSVIDLHAALRFCSDIQADQLRLTDATPLTHVQATPAFEHVQWRVPSSVKTAILSAEGALINRAAGVDLAALDFGDFGRSLLASHRVSPDAFVQMAFQVAYMWTYARTGVPREAIVTKLLQAGGAEENYVVTPESIALATLLSHDSVSADASSRARIERLSQRDAHRAARRQEERAALFAALHAHVEAVGTDSSSSSSASSSSSPADTLSTTSSTTPDVFGGFSSAEDAEDAEEEVVEFSPSSSSSSCSKWSKSPALKLFGFAPVTSSCLSLGYMVHANGIAACASKANPGLGPGFSAGPSKASAEAGPFLDALRLTFLQLGALLEAHDFM